MKQAVLFVVNDSKVLGDLQKLRHGWDAVYASNSAQALQALGQRDFTAVVADSNIRGDTDAPFLLQVQNRFPKLVRLLLCDPAEKKALKSDGSFHQPLLKPCSVESISSAMQRAQLLDHWMADPAIKKLFAQMRKLPSVPSIYLRLVQKLQSPETDLEEIGRLLAEDPGMTAKVLQVVNSAVFGLGRTVASPVEAVSYLGMERVKALVLMTQAFSGAEADPAAASFVEMLWQHSMLVGKLARMIAREEAGDPELAEEAYTAGVLHDVGKLMFTANLPQEYAVVRQNARKQQAPLEGVEKEALGASHAEMGACVLGIWGLPSAIVETIAFHHQPSGHSVKKFCALAAVHLANALAHEMQGTEAASRKLDLPYLAEVGLANRMEIWRSMCRGGG